MFTRKKKMERVSMAKPENRLLRLLRSNDVFQGSISSLENTSQEDVYDEDPRIVGNAMREIEYKNAKALLLGCQNNQRIC